MPKIRVPRVSCILPVFNEAKRLSEVLKLVSSYSLFYEVIVVDDGSSDTTFKIAKKFDVVTCRHTQNLGKSAAIYSGLKNSTGEIIVLMDGDLCHVTHEHLTKLIRPSFTHDCMSLALLENTWPIFHLTGLDPWSGERVLPRWVLEEVFKESEVRHQKYAIESIINQFVIDNQLPIYSVYWSQVKNIPKAEKATNSFIGLTKELKMYFEIYKTFGMLQTVGQQIRMPLLARKSASR